MREKSLPMGKTFNCQLGYFELPSEIYEIQIHDDIIYFQCEDGFYEGTCEGDSKIKIRKVKNKGWV